MLRNWTHTHSSLWARVHPYLTHCFIMQLIMNGLCIGICGCAMHVVPLWTWTAPINGGPVGPGATGLPPSEWTDHHHHSSWETSCWASTRFFKSTRRNKNWWTMVSPGDKAVVVLCVCVGAQNRWCGEGNEDWLAGENVKRDKVWGRMSGGLWWSDCHLQGMGSWSTARVSRQFHSFK